MKKTLILLLLILIACPLFAVLQQVAFVFFQQQVVQLALFRRGNPVLAQALKNRVDLIQVDGHVFEAIPMVGTPVRHNALP